MTTSFFSCLNKDCLIRRSKNTESGFHGSGGGLLGTQNPVFMDWDLGGGLFRDTESSFHGSG